MLLRVQNVLVFNFSYHWDLHELTVTVVTMGPEWMKGIVLISLFVLTLAFRLVISSFVPSLTCSSQLKLPLTLATSLEGGVTVITRIDERDCSHQSVCSYISILVSPANHLILKAKLHHQSYRVLSACRMTSSYLQMTFESLDGDSTVTRHTTELMVNLNTPCFV